MIKITFRSILTHFFSFCPRPVLAAPGSADVRLEYLPSGPFRLVLTGRLDSAGVAAVWDRALSLDVAGQGAELVVDVSAVEYLDSSGFGLIAMLCIRHGELAGRHYVVVGLKAGVAALWERMDLKALSWEGEAFSSPSLAEEVGRQIHWLLADLAGQVIFFGELIMAGVDIFRRRSCVRWSDVLRICRNVGVNAFPIVALIGFLMGLITAFQSAVPLKRFGADVYVSDLLGLSMIRELGPLVTAILLAGRSGSAFAAEVGTMKVNEEIDALVTMGFDPVRFLAVPRILAVLVVTPVLMVFFNFFALAGGALVVTNFGYALMTYMNRVASAVRPGDMFGGLLKTVVFSLLVSAIGCYRGLKAGDGPTAVGAAATSAVVSGLVLLAVADGILALVFYALRF
ncbi:phospholipid/cholesterol/gamma-HCH transport system permease protein [Desulfovibrionales bacterium]